ncbi:hypothetical protein E4631_07260 [Hymenobacter sp. UV11]|uniref:hypothetical protein n=1 Tax=Hymenobacter sp. UV11 TaxID=1849735 RepID=UPI00105E0751|nr:hypothetical protein [Hymenobacter sp. UV11]TFZ67757.1 hypothetical protein E4631_07260 [Hymenobacter sp. UV11]
MKYSLLLVGLLGFTFSARAQYMPGAVSLVTLGVRALSNRDAPQQKATLFVTPATYQAHAFPQKRTPTKKLPRADKGGTEIAALEQLLAGRFTALQADSTAVLLDVAQEKEFGRLRTNLESFNPFWNTDPYSQEMSLYRQHDAVRRRLAR